MIAYEGLENMFWYIIASIVLLTPCTALADLKLPQIFSDGMVVQRVQVIPVWGWGAEGNRVTVAFNGQTKSAVVTDGKWRVNLDPMPANATSQVMTITSADQTHLIEDVLVGEVWFTCGQSNMMMGLSSATGGLAYYEAHQPKSNGRVRVVFEMGQSLRSKTVKSDVTARWRTEPPSSYSAVSYYFAHKLFEHFGGEVPVGMVTYVAIVPAEAWVDAGRIAGHPNLRYLPTHPLKVASQLYNGTIAPVSPYALRGVIYYQAEYNGGRYLEFRDLFPALIASWREAWERPDLPFLFVQLPSFVAQEAPPSSIDMDAATLAQYSKASRYTWVGMRDVQRWIWQNTPNTGLAVTIDVGERYDIHPPNKEPVADRLLLSARKVAYGEDVVYSGPWPRSYTARNGVIVITFDHVGDGLMAKGDKLLGFEVAGADNHFVAADAKIDSDKVIVSSPKVSDPIHVRYAWAGFPSCTLYNREGLPTSPFQHSMPGRTFYPDTATFEFHNPNFEQQRDGAPADWGKVEASSRASKGRASARLTPGGRIHQSNLADRTGYYWNADPSGPHFLRPGCIAGYSVDLAAEQDGTTATGYMNLCATHTAGGYQAWGGIPNISTASTSFVERHIVHQMTDRNLDAHVNWRNSAGGRWINQSKQDVLLLDNFSSVRIVRPLLDVNTSGPIVLAANKPSEPIVIRNMQDKALPQLLTDEAEPKDVPTLLYGCASFQQDNRGLMQKVTDRTDHVGVVLVGKDADLFELSGANATEDGRVVKLIGDDGKVGLHGGSEPETETFTVRFIDKDKTGDHTATLRIVTQACNAGTLSRGEAGEPPVNLYYLDIQVRATTKE